MAQIEYVPRPTCGVSENFSDSSTDVLRQGKKGYWI